MADFLNKIGSFSSEVGAEISAFDAASQHLFIVAGQTTVEVVNLSNPAAPVSAGVLKLTDLIPNAGGANSVAVNNGRLAIAIAAAEPTAPGTVLLVDIKVFLANSGNNNAFKPFTVGSLPDMLTFTPDGKKILVANEGEPKSDYSLDPQGSISIIDLASQAVTTAGFSGFNDQKAALINQGVRIFGPSATVAQDLEPEYIAVSPDSATAFVTLQENNAFAVVDVATATVQEIKPLGSKNHNQPTVTGLEAYTFTNLPVLGTTAAGQELPLGGFSGLTFEGYAANGNLKFITHTDRGPNGEPTGINRPFFLPDFAPEIIRFELNRTSGQLSLTQRIQLKDASGSLLSGLPNTAISSNASQPYNDEVPVDLQGNVLPRAALGADLEGIVVAPDGTFWMVDEYRPAIYHFTSNGVLIDRFVPKGTAAAAGQAAGTFGKEVLPEVLGQRRQNRGFEGVALQDGKLYAFVQSPIRNPATASNSALNGLQNIRIVEFDPANNATRQFLYTMDNAPAVNATDTRADKIGDAVAIGNGEFLVLERDDDAIDSDPASQIQKKVYRFSLESATDISALSGAIDVGAGVLKTVDQMTPAELQAAGVKPVNKALHVDLTTAGYNTVEKVEGLTIVDRNTLAVINDNDFTVGGITINPATGTFTPDPNAEKPVLGLITLQNNGLDASDRDSSINIRNWPVFGLYQPDAIASYSVNGKTYYVTANEGDSRDYSGFSEEARVKDLTLDPSAFPNAATLKADKNLGRLKTTTTLGDSDGDGDVDRIYTYGGRSFSIWDSQGNQVYDSGDAIAQITAAEAPTLFNSQGDAASFDSRSDDKGAEPEAVTIGQVDGKTYAFIGLERTGGILAYDVTNPTAPSFVDYLQTPGDVAPEGLAFVPAAQSPNGQNLLLVSNEVSKTVSVLKVGDTIAPPKTFTLELLHAADQEAAVPALTDAPNFSAVLKALRNQDLGNDGKVDNTITLSSGDAYIPGLFLSASGEAFGGVGRADILIQNELGFEAIAFGNHEFDLGTAVIKDLIGGAVDNPATPTVNESFVGTTFPYLSSNLDFSTDANLAGLVVPNGQAPKAQSIAASTVITVNGEKIGVVGATTPTIKNTNVSISSPGNVTVLPTPFDGVPTPAQLDALAAEIQADVDALLLANPGINKVILLAHMQQIGIEQALAERLSKVDIIVAGGSNTRLFDANDVLRAGDTNQGTYPIVKTGADGKPIAVVNTDGNYKYVGRLVLDFDANGVIIPASYDPTVSGAYATDVAGVAALNASGLVDPEIQAIVNQLRDVINATESNVFGVSNVYLNGVRGSSRTEETNLGNLTADANLAIAQQTDPTTVISIKNGGGIRNPIGRLIVPAGGTGSAEALPNEAIPGVKPEGGISQTDIANALSFNNGLTLVTVTAAELAKVLEHGVAASTGSNTPGQFPQVAGVEFSFDLTKSAGDRIQSLAVLNANGKDADVLIRNGELVGDPSRSFRIVTLGFLATGGDGYPFPTGPAAQVVNLTQAENAPRTGVATFAANGSEQDALAEYLAANFGNAAKAFDKADTAAAKDTRIQNLAVRSDTVIDVLAGGGGSNGSGSNSGSNGSGDNGGGNNGGGNNGGTGNNILFENDGLNLLVGGAGDDFIYGGNQADRILSGSGNDVIYANGGADVIDSGSGLDQVWLGGAGNATIILSQGEGFDFIANYQMGMTQLKGFAASELSFEANVSAGNGLSGVGISKGGDLLAVVGWKTQGELAGALVA